MKEYDPWEIPEALNKRGRRTQIEVDLDQVKVLAQIGCTKKEIGRLLLGMADNHFAEYRKKHPEVEEAIQDGQANLCKSLRHAQVKSAVDEGNVQMLIHLGKVYLDQSDKLSIDQKVTGDLIIDAEFRKTDAPDEGSSA